MMLVWVVRSSDRRPRPSWLPCPEPVATLRGRVLAAALVAADTVLTARVQVMRSWSSPIVGGRLVAGDDGGLGQALV